MSEGKIQGTVMAGAANEALNPSNAAPSPAARMSVIEALAAKQGDMELIEGEIVTLGVKKPLGSNYLRAIEMADGNANLVPFIEAMLCVVEIDGQPHTAPRNKSQLYALADTIGRETIESLLAWYQNKTAPEIQEILAENPNIDVTSPEFQQLLQAKRALKAKKSRETR